MHLGEGQGEDSSPEKDGSPDPSDTPARKRVSKELLKEDSNPSDYENRDINVRPDRVIFPEDVEIRKLKLKARKRKLNRKDKKKLRRLQDRLKRLTDKIVSPSGYCFAGILILTIDATNTKDR